MFGQLGGDGESAVERHAGVQQRRQFLREEKNVAALAALEDRQLERRPGLLFQADIHRNQSLALQFGGDVTVSLGG